MEGRFFNDGDGPDAPLRSAIVNQTLARTYWPNECAIGHRMKSGGGPTRRGARS